MTSGGSGSRDIAALVAENAFDARQITLLDAVTRMQKSNVIQYLLLGGFWEFSEFYQNLFAIHCVCPQVQKVPALHLIVLYNRIFQELTLAVRRCSRCSTR